MVAGHDGIICSLHGWDAAVQGPLEGVRAAWQVCDARQGEPGVLLHFGGWWRCSPVGLVLFVWHSCSMCIGWCPSLWEESCCSSWLRMCSGVHRWCCCVLASLQMVAMARNLVGSSPSCGTVGGFDWLGVPVFGVARHLTLRLERNQAAAMSCRCVQIIV